MMVHTDIFKKYKRTCSISNGSINSWYPNGRNSVRIRLYNKKEVVFTYHGPRNWKIESMEAFLASITKPLNQIQKGEFI